jgi:hypothetical protein
VEQKVNKISKEENDGMREKMTKCGRKARKAKAKGGER